MALPQKLEPMKVLIGALQQNFRVKILIRFIFFFLLFDRFHSNARNEPSPVSKKKISQVAKKEKWEEVKMRNKITSVAKAEKKHLNCFASKKSF